MPILSDKPHIAPRHGIEEDKKAMTNDNETERTRSALFTISPDLPHDQWVRVGMAAHAGGLSFDEWDGMEPTGQQLQPSHRQGRMAQLFRQARRGDGGHTVSDRTGERMG